MTPEQGDPRIEAALPEAMDFLPDHPCRQERVARAMLDRVFAAVDALASQPVVERQITDEMVERARVAINDIRAVHLTKAAEGHPWAEELIARAALEAALETGELERLERERNEALVQLSMREAECAWLREVERAARAVVTSHEVPPYVNPGRATVSDAAVGDLRSALSPNQPEEE